MIDKAELTIRHDAVRHRFIAELDGDAGVLDYEPASRGTLNYKHTFVPQPLRGQGIATELVKYALDYAQEHKLKVIASCPFVAAVIEQNRERYAALLPKGRS